MVYITRLRDIKFDVPDFRVEHNTDAFLDWKHRMKTYFRWYDMPEEHKLQFAKTKLTETARIWWTSYKKSFSKSGNGEITT